MKVPPSKGVQVMTKQIKVYAEKIPVSVDYLTAGKTYICDLEDDNNYGNITNDFGRRNLLYLPGCAHLDDAAWVIVP